VLSIWSFAALCSLRCRLRFWRIQAARVAPGVGRRSIRNISQRTLVCSFGRFIRFDLLLRFRRRRWRSWGCLTLTLAVSRARQYGNHRRGADNAHASHPKLCVGCQAPTTAGSDGFGILGHAAGGPPITGRAPIKHGPCQPSAAHEMRMVLAF